LQTEAAFKVKEERSTEIAKNLISIGLSAEDISKATGLTMSQIENLRFEK